MTMEDRRVMFFGFTSVWLLLFIFVLPEIKVVFGVASFICLGMMALWADK